jgi:hypothetical protein
LWACRVGGPGSAVAASRAQDSSGARSFPSTPAPAIWVVGVISDRVDALGLDPDPHALPATTTAAATVAAEAAAMIDRLPPNCTRSTLTSDQLAPVCRNDPPTPLRHLRQFVGPDLPPT